jgi:hypothetical protein
LCDFRHPVTAGGGDEERSFLRQKPPNPSAFHAISSRRAIAIHQPVQRMHEAFQE